VLDFLAAQGEQWEGWFGLQRPWDGWSKNCRRNCELRKGRKTAGESMGLDESFDPFRGRTAMALIVS
jgi:hypothetical protein